MSHKEITHSFINPLTENLTEILSQGLKLIEKIDDASFTAGAKDSVGVHFQHCADFIENFLKGIEIEKIDYNQRERNVEMERNRAIAILRLSVINFKLDVSDYSCHNFITNIIFQIYWCRRIKIYLFNPDGRGK